MDDNKKDQSTFSFLQSLFKIIGWGILGVAIKYAFTGFSAIPQALIDKHLLPAHLQIGLAALWSVMLGLILGYFKRGSDS